ncbi:hypothetical protein SI65_08724 [Aspergillus cristatus]|uniref:Transcription factor TFIIIC triple barrel domain-containing protein n=1 Tax=Aspergillus cristatus TaxID=573508 RepID=A0A1E3B4K5_ASPCR|nr:hypothetical protein SI65_08724 [Aspergillus cristatus]
MSLNPTPLAAPVPSANADSDSDSDWEYEYSTETESFYLNLDLTSVHGPLRPPRRRNASAPNNNNAANEPDADPDPDADADFSRPLETTESDANNPARHAAASATASAGATAQDRLQVLGLHTLNPIVSYQNQVFSCSWAEQIGTELFFTRPDELITTTTTGAAENDVEPLARGKDFDLIAATSAKILGRKANLISSSEPSTTTPSTSTSNPPKPSTSSNQARFLDRLSSVKQAKGETDTVRTVYSTRRTQNLEDRLRGWARTEQQLTEVQRLQEAVLRGDEGAMAALEKVYRDLQGNDGDCDGGV